MPKAGERDIQPSLNATSIEIKVRDDHMLEFRSIFGRVAVSPGEIKAVRAKRYALGFVDVVPESGKVDLLNPIDGFHDFLATLKASNPTVKRQGRGRFV